MIAIINDGSSQSKTGLHGYRVQVNSELICTFTHTREDGLSTCLRKAADAVDAVKAQPKFTGQMWEKEIDTLVKMCEGGLLK